MHVCRLSKEFLGGARAAGVLSGTPYEGTDLSEGAGGRASVSSLDGPHVYEQVEKSGRAVWSRERQEIWRSQR